MSDDLHSKYQEFVKNGDVESVLILKGHLVIEELLTMAITATTGSEKEITEAKLSFSQKRLIAKALAGPNKSDGIWKIIDTLNKLRNDVGHNLTPQKSENLVDKLRSQLIGRDSVAYGLIPNPNDSNQIISHAVSFSIGFLEAYLRERNA